MYLIVGGSGFLGAYVIKNILNTTQDKIIATYNSSLSDVRSDRVSWEKLDFESFDSIDCFVDKLSNVNDLKVVLLSAYHHPDKVEQNPQLAWHINIAALDYFLSKTKKLINTLVYSSTDSVYGESVNNHIFSEGDKASPVNTYGRTKAIAEQVILLYGFTVLRYSFLIGPSIITHKEHFYDHIFNVLKHNEDIKMFSDSYRSPIDFNSAAYYTVQLIENELININSEIINIAGDYHLSKYDVAKIIAENHNFNIDNIKKITINDSLGVGNFKTKRAGSTLIDNKKLKTLLGVDSIALNLT